MLCFVFHTVCWSEHRSCTQEGRHESVSDAGARQPVSQLVCAVNCVSVPVLILQSHFLNIQSCSFISNQFPFLLFQYIYFPTVLPFSISPTPSALFHSHLPYFKHIISFPFFRWAVILAFDVRVERDAQEMADSLGVKIFVADIIYHLFDNFLKHRAVGV